MITVRDVDVPVIGLGTWELEGDTAYDSVRAAIEVGYRHIDTAQAYGNEEQVGRAIADSGVDRDQLFVTTKVWRSKAAPEDVDASTAESLDRLGLDHVDLLLVHWPSDAAPIEATVEALAAQADKDRTRLIGVSNYTLSQFARATAAGPVATNQVEHHVMLDQEGLVSAAHAEDGFLTAYSPLAHGEVFGDDTIAGIAEEHDVSTAQVALAYLLRQDDVAVLPRSSSRDHIEDNLRSLELELTEDDVAALDGLPKDRRQIDPPFAPDWD